jgi:hypothetical protein
MPIRNVKKKYRRPNNAIGKDELAGLAAMQIPVVVGEFEA